MLTRVFFTDTQGLFMQVSVYYMYCVMKGSNKVVFWIAKAEYQYHASSRADHHRPITFDDHEPPYNNSNRIVVIAIINLLSS